MAQQHWHTFEVHPEGKKFATVMRVDGYVFKTLYSKRRATAVAKGVKHRLAGDRPYLAIHDECFWPRCQCHSLCHIGQAEMMRRPPMINLAVA